MNEVIILSNGVEVVAEKFGRNYAEMFYNQGVMAADRDAEIAMGEGYTKEDLEKLYPFVVKHMQELTDGSTNSTDSGDDVVREAVEQDAGQEIEEATAVATTQAEVSPDVREASED